MIPSLFSVRTNTELFDSVLDVWWNTLRGGLVPVQPAEVDSAGVILIAHDVHLQLGLPLLHVQLEGGQG